VVRASRAALILLMAAIAGGCAHHSETTPQQQFLEALKRGNSAQASQIWLHMSPEQRVMFERGQGLQPAQSPKQVQMEVMRRALEEANGEEPEQAPATPPLGGALGNLPELLNSQQAGGGANPP
jgi:hypothetical protein